MNKYFYLEKQKDNIRKIKNNTKRKIIACLVNMYRMTKYFTECYFSAEAEIHILVRQCFKSVELMLRVIENYFHTNKFSNIYFLLLMILTEICQF